MRDSKKTTTVTINKETKELLISSRQAVNAYRQRCKMATRVKSWSELIETALKNLTTQLDGVN